LIKKIAYSQSLEEVLPQYYILGGQAYLKDSIEQAKTELFEDSPELKNQTIEMQINRIKRYQQIVTKIKKKYKSRCQVDGCGFTFLMKNNEHYCEAHHLIPLSEGGSQLEDNIVILCANHHRMFHFSKEISIGEKEDSIRIINLNGDELIIHYELSQSTSTSSKNISL
jgi:predicted restriction endonuclease